MTGYTRKDTTNNIADGNIVNASDLDNEFDGIVAAFNAATGHAHGGGAGEGAPILSLGPTQDVTVSATLMAPKTTNTIDIGSSVLKFKDLYLAGNATVGGTLGVTGITTLAANPVLSGGTANGVGYLNATKQFTTGTALTFDGTYFYAGGLRLRGLDTSNTIYQSTGALNITSQDSYIGIKTLADVPVIFTINSAEQMRLTSTGLGIGTSSPSAKLDVAKTSSDTISRTNASGVFGDFQSLGAGLLMQQTLSSPYGFALQAANAANTAQFPLLLNPSGGNVGIGTSSPNILSWNKSLTTNTASGNAAYEIAIGGVAQAYFAADATNVYLAAYANKPLIIRTNNATVATFDTSGNLGLGVTPSAWASGSRALQLGAGGSGYGALSLDTSGGTRLLSNAYESAAGVYKYVASLGASMYLSNFGTHQWYNAPSGTANNPITFIQAMTLDASGNLLVGTTNALGRVTIVGSAGSSKNLVLDSNASYGEIQTYSAPLYLNRQGNDIIANSGGGSLLLGTTTKAGNASTFYSGTAGQQPVSVWNGATSGNNYFFEFGTEGTYTARGSITYNRAGGLVAYNTASDYRAKEVFGPVADSGSVIDSVPVYTGKMKGATQERPMFIAHETPSYAHTGEKDAVDADGNPVYQQMDASALIPVMWAEIQSLRKRLAAAGIA
jgi:hypothetical protein